MKFIQNKIVHTENDAELQVEFYADSTSSSMQASGDIVTPSGIYAAGGSINGVLQVGSVDSDGIPSGGLFSQDYVDAMNMYSSYSFCNTLNVYTTDDVSQRLTLDVANDQVTMSNKNGETSIFVNDDGLPTHFKGLTVQSGLTTCADGLTVQGGLITESSDDSILTHYTNGKYRQIGIQQNANNNWHLMFRESSDNVTWGAWKEDGTSTMFTGQHKSLTIDDALLVNHTSYIGRIVCSSGTVEKLQINDAWPYIKLSSSFADKSVYGVISGSENGRIIVNSLGEGAIWIVDTHGPIENGDYICSSTISGFGCKQSDDILHNYTVAKATLSCDFSTNIKYIDSNGDEIIESEYNPESHFKTSFVACTYHCG